VALGTSLSPDEVTPPDKIRAISGDDIVVAGAQDTLVLDAPDLWPLVAGRPVVLAPLELASRLADLLDLPLVSEEIAGTVQSKGQRRAVPRIVRDVLPGAPPHYQAHDSLVVDGQRIGWRYRDGVIHAATSEGLASGLAWATGQWQLRNMITALLTSPQEAARLLAEADLDSA
jgi:hypothetical protein